MAHQVIARKFRPQTFSEVIGQEHISKTLGRAIETGRIHHAYLFTGSRGVGKTSMARILAKALNCEKGPTLTPCGDCLSCKEITDGINLDVREIDGASNTGVDDVRELRENIRYMPTTGRYRIFIIDEVHMLSTSAFNALLKTLEEPPAHIIFIFATTEPHKILDTILSRCQRYDFRLLTHQKILEQLQKISQKENFSVDDHALHLLAHEAGGSMRDAETLLEQVLSFSGDTITAEIVTQSLGLIDRKILVDTLQFILKRDGANLLNAVKNLYDYGHDIKHFAKDLLEQLRHLNVILACNPSPASDGLLDLPQNEIDALKKLAGEINGAEAQRLYRLFSSEFYEISRSSNQRISLEMALLRLIQAPPLNDITTLLDEIKALKSDMPQSIRPTSRASHAPHAIPHKPAHRPSPKAPEPLGVASAPLWDQLIETVKKDNPSIAFSLMETRPLTCTPQAITIGVAQGSIVQDKLVRMSSQEVIRQTVKNLTGSVPRLEIKVSQDLKPAKAPSQKDLELKEKLSQEVQKNPVYQEIKEVLGAKLEDVRLQNPPSK